LEVNLIKGCYIGKTDQLHIKVAGSNGKGVRYVYDCEGQSEDFWHTIVMNGEMKDINLSMEYKSLAIYDLKKNDDGSYSTINDKFERISLEVR
jgi:hypothetical protein